MLTVMKREEIAHLAVLSRVRLSDEEISNLEGELSSIVEYVSVVKDIAADDTASTPQVGARYNIFRQDEVTNEPDQYTKDILAEAPTTEGRYLSVKKILDIGD
jgi:aspartyl-tRNA(Asn)/glutamyl-tRNA(Gln) amidotransferase subunit C